MKFKSFAKTGMMSLFLALSISSVNAFAGPDYFTTRNFTPYESNAKVKGIMSPFPTPAGSPEAPKERSISWGKLRIVCGLFSKTCDAEIFMKTDTDTPIPVGKGTMNLKTGEITPNRMVQNGFVLTSNEPGVIEIREDK